VGRPGRFQFGELEGAPGSAVREREFDAGAVGVEVRELADPVDGDRVGEASPPTAIREPTRPNVQRCRSRRMVQIGTVIPSW